MLGYEVTRRYGADGLPDDTIRLQFTGSAGQSFGAFVPRGITLRSRATRTTTSARGCRAARSSSIRRAQATFVPEENIIIGNVALYGATSGEAYIRGVAGERFAVRNSGAHAVVEGVGDHGCEYMTGGRVVVLGRTGRNFAAGMSGGIAYVFDAAGDFRQRCNHELVDLEPLEQLEDIELVRIARSQRHVQLHRQRAWRRASSPAGAGRSAMFVKVMPRDYKRALEAEARTAAAAGARARRGDRGRRQWVRPPDSSRSRARSIRRARSSSASTTGARSTCRIPRPRSPSQAARCMDCGIPFCHSGCPLGNLIPDWNDLVYREPVADGDRSPARDQQFS